MVTCVSRVCGSHRPGRAVAAVLVLCAGLVTAPRAHAAALFFAGEVNKKGEYTPDPEVKGHCFSVRFSTITVELDGDQARTTSTETLEGYAHGAGLIVCLTPLPAGVERAGDMTVKPEFALRLQPQFLSPGQARPLYESLAKATGDLRLLSFCGQPALLTQGFPAGWLDRKVEVTVTYQQTVKEKDGLSEYRCTMPGGAGAKDPATRVTLTATLKNKLPLRAVFSPSHEISTERPALHEARVHMSADNVRGDEDFVLYSVAAEDPLGLRLISHRAEGEAEGYFLLVGNPTGSDQPAKIVEKDVLFVLDTSGSMRGEKLEQARAAIDYVLEKLNPGDRFNLVTFGTEVQSFASDLAARTPENLKLARAFADDVVASGRTNISGALTKALAGKPTAGRLRLMLFLTDGTPTAGELVPEEILKKLPEWNTSATRIFVLGVGHDVNVHLLDRLALTTEGSAEYVGPDEELDAKVAALYNRLAFPFLNNAKVDFGALAVQSLYPSKLPALFRGSEVMLVGRYRGGGKVTVTLSGDLAGEEQKYTCAAELPAGAAPANEYVAVLWAARTIGFLLQEIRLHGENKELIEEVVRLSRRFGIVTEYTAFLTTADAGATDKDLAPRAAAAMAEANREQAGAWAVNQAQNEQALQQGMARGGGANVFRDRQGHVQAQENLRQVGRRVFVLRGEQWVENDDGVARKARTVKLFSPEYMELIRSNPDFAKAQSVGGQVTVNVGNERIEVQK